MSPRYVAYMYGGVLLIHTLCVQQMEVMNWPWANILLCRAHIWRDGWHMSLCTLSYMVHYQKGNCYYGRVGGTWGQFDMSGPEPLGLWSGLSEPVFDWSLN